MLVSRVLALPALSVFSMNLAFLFFLTPFSLVYLCGGRFLTFRKIFFGCHNVFAAFFFLVIF